MDTNDTGIGETKQSSPSPQYLILLGKSLSVFNSNNGFVIENIIRKHHNGKYSDYAEWFKLVDSTSGVLVNELRKCIDADHFKICDSFQDVVNRRNRIIHSFQATNEKHDQVLVTKIKGSGKQVEITTDYLIDFIKRNEDLSSKLYKLRGH